MSASEKDLIHVSERNGILLVEVAAEQLTAVKAVDQFDHCMRELLEDFSQTTWLVDFRDVTFLVTPAVNTLLSLTKQLRARNGALILCGVNENIRRVFALMKLDRVFTIDEDVEAAMQRLSRVDE